MSYQQTSDTSSNPILKITSEITSEIRTEITSEITSETIPEERTELSILLDQTRKFNKDINTKHREIRTLKDTISDNQKTIWNLCEHDWEKEPAQMNEHTTYICKICHLYKNYYMYR